MKVTQTLTVIPHDEWEDHSYIKEVIGFKPINFNRYGPVPNVLVPELIKELEDKFKNTMESFDKMLPDILLHVERGE